MWVAVLASIVALCSGASVDPEQVHLSTQGNLTSMAVTWITKHHYASSNTKSLVRYGTSPDKLDQLNDNARLTTWYDNGPEHSQRITHRIRMTGLKGGVRYYYSVGSAEAMSPVYNFKMPDPFAKSYRYAIFGDMGLSRDYSLQQLIKDVKADMFDMVFHIGDIAYDLDSGDGYVGDLFMNAIVPVAAYVPYMVIAGNHEKSDTNGWSHFIHRFTTPITNKDERDNQFWSFDLGPIHFVGMSSEYYCYKMLKESHDFYSWLQQDLAATHNQWIVALMHRPMYCSALCDAWENTILRNGDNNYNALEPVIGKYGVDLMFTGHKHYYERMSPVYKGLAFKNTGSSVHNARAPLYYVTGAAGCHSHIDVKGVKAKPFSEFMTSDYGYSILEVTGQNQLKVWYKTEYGVELDHFTITKDDGWRPKQAF